MVVFDLTCINGHEFEGWFESLADLEKQIQDKILVCPVCNEVTVFRRPSTFGLVKSRPPERQVSDNTPEQPDLAHLAKAFEQLQAISHALETDFTDVGSKFSEEALKIHYGVSPKRNIRGMSTEDQEQMLKKEGVDFFKVPMLVRKTPLT
ncbi:MAG: DUF1178 family protein [Deltaproteobacteria bacterium]|jgi:hypothetical protein|nr:DUF1178 family protein [Deltaproteobacteria bacterium]